TRSDVLKRDAWPQICLPMVLRSALLHIFQNMGPQPPSTVHSHPPPTPVSPPPGPVPLPKYSWACLRSTSPGDNSLRFYCAPAESPRVYVCLLCAVNLP